jgi:hypothetical protein
MKTSTGFGAILQRLLTLIMGMFKGASATQPRDTRGDVTRSGPRDGYHGIVWRKMLLDGVEFWVATDYLKTAEGRYIMGSQEEAEQAMASFAGTEMPTPRQVDLIWRKADHKLAPIPMPPVKEMIRDSYQWKHQIKVESPMAGLEIKPGDVIAGHKKDVVKQHNSGRTTIYGWHELSGEPIQPASSVHNRSYSDYSQGIRLLRRVK